MWLRRIEPRAVGAIEWVARLAIDREALRVVGAPAEASAPGIAALLTEGAGATVCIDVAATTADRIRVRSRHAAVLRLQAFSTHRGVSATALKSLSFLLVRVVALSACASAPVAAPEVGAQPPLPPRTRPPYP